jgi:RHS repeat-associated protein
MLLRTTLDGQGATETKRYSGGFTYRDADGTGAGGEALDHLGHAGGRVRYYADTGLLAYQYAFSDHLGNTRVLAEPDGQGIVQETAYYPYGLQIADLGGGSSTNEELYNGKELTESHGLNWYHYGARYYDVAIARWTTMDPADEFHSPYVYVGGDPVNLVDPDGRQAYPIVFPDYQIQVGDRSVPYLGHAGILMVNPQTGYTRYYEYGRYDAEGRGIVRNKAVPNATIDPDTGTPTAASLSRIMSVISQQSGQGTRIEAAQIEEADFSDMYKYAENRMKQNSDPNRQAYDTFNCNCGTFMLDVLEAGGVDLPIILDPRPNSMIENLQDDHPDVSYNPEGNNLDVESSGQGGSWWKFWD